MNFVAVQYGKMISFLLLCIIVAWQHNLLSVYKLMIYNVKI